MDRFNFIIGVLSSAYAASNRNHGKCENAESVS